jgi:hypothetical protein
VKEPGCIVQDPRCDDTERRGVFQRVRNYPVGQCKRSCGSRIFFAIPWGRSNRGSRAFIRSFAKRLDPRVQELRSSLDYTTTALNGFCHLRRRSLEYHKVCSVGRSVIAVDLVVVNHTFVSEGIYTSLHYRYISIPLAIARPTFYLSQSISTTFPVKPPSSRPPGS